MKLNLTPADFGIIAAALDDARAEGLGDDLTVDYLASAIFNEVGGTQAQAADLAYDVVHKRLTR